MIERCRDSFPVQMMCRCLGVSTSGYYDWEKRPLSPRASANQALSEQIASLHDGSDGVLGAPRMHAELLFQGWPCRTYVDTHHFVD